MPKDPSDTSGKRDERAVARVMAQAFRSLAAMKRREAETLERFARIWANRLAKTIKEDGDE